MSVKVVNDMGDLRPMDVQSQRIKEINQRTNEASLSPEVDSTFAVSGEPVSSSWLDRETVESVLSIAAVSEDSDSIRATMLNSIR